MQELPQISNIQKRLKTVEAQIDTKSKEKLENRINQIKSIKFYEVQNSPTKIFSPINRKHLERRAPSLNSSVKRFHEKEPNEVKSKFSNQHLESEDKKTIDSTNESIKKLKQENEELKSFLKKQSQLLASFREFLMKERLSVEIQTEKSKISDDQSSIKFVSQESQTEKPSEHNLQERCVNCSNGISKIEKLADVLQSLTRKFEQNVENKEMRSSIKESVQVIESDSTVQDDEKFIMSLQKMTELTPNVRRNQNKRSSLDVSFMAKQNGITNVASNADIRSSFIRKLPTITVNRNHDTQTEDGLVSRIIILCHAGILNKTKRNLLRLFMITTFDATVINSHELSVLSNSQESNFIIECDDEEVVKVVQKVTLKRKIDCFVSLGEFNFRLLENEIKIQIIGDIFTIICVDYEIFQRIESVFSISKIKKLKPNCFLILFNYSNEVISKLSETCPISLLENRDMNLENLCLEALGMKSFKTTAITFGESALSKFMNLFGESLSFFEGKLQFICEKKFEPDISARGFRNTVSCPEQNISEFIKELNFPAFNNPQKVIILIGSNPKKSDFMKTLELLDSQYERINVTNYTFSKDLKYPYLHEGTITKCIMHQVIKCVTSDSSKLLQPKVLIDIDFPLQNIFANLVKALKVCFTTKTAFKIFIFPSFTVISPCTMIKTNFFEMQYVNEGISSKNIFDMVKQIKEEIN